MPTKTTIDKSNHKVSSDGWSKMVPKSKADKEEEKRKIKAEREKRFKEIEAKREKDRLLRRSSHHSTNTNNTTTSRNSSSNNNQRPRPSQRKSQRNEPQPVSSSMR